VLDSRRRLLRCVELEGLEERDRRVPWRVLVKGRVTGIHESVRLVEHPSLSIEETLEEGHPYHPIPRGAVNPGPRRTSGRHAKRMTYRYRQRPCAVDNRPTSSTPGRCDTRVKYAPLDFQLTIVRRDRRWHAEDAGSTPAPRTRSCSKK